MTAATDFNSYWLDVYAAKQALLNAIDADNRTRAKVNAQNIIDTGVAAAADATVKANATAVTAAADATAKVNAAKAVLEASIAVLNGQVADITGADVYDSGKAYPASDLVRDGGTPGHLYRALQAVPAGMPLTNTAYWQLIGNYSSLGEAVAATAVTVATNVTNLAAVTNSLAILIARMPTGTDTLANEARVVAAQNAAASATSAVAAALDLVEARMPSGTDELATAASVASAASAAASATSAVASDLAALSGAVNDPTTGLSSRASNNRVSTVEGRLNDTGAGKTVETVASDAAALSVAVNDPSTGLSAKASLSALNEVAGNLDTVSDTVNTHTSQISAANSAISGKAAQTALDATNTNVSANTAAVSAHGDRLNSLEGSVNDPSTGLTARALQSQYAATATQVGINTGAISAQSMLLNTVKASIGQSTDNLVKKSTFSSDLNRGAWTTGTVISSGVHPSEPYLLQMSTGGYEDVYFPVTPGDQYDLSIDIFTGDLSGTGMVFGLHTITASGTNQFDAIISDNTRSAMHTATGRVTIPAGAVTGRPFINVSGTLYWTKFRIERVSTAAAQNASATSLLDARVGITEGGLATAQATWGVQLDVNGFVVGVYALNDGTTGQLIFDMDEVIFSSSNGGSSISGGIITQRKGGYMTVNGPGFGAGSDLLEWFGPDMPVANCTTVNAISYKTISGELPDPPPAPTGTEIKFNAASESTASPNTLQLVNNNTTGASKTVTANYYFQSTNQNTTESASNGSATLSLWRKVGAGSFVQLGSTQNVTLYDTVEPGSPGKWRHSLEGACNLVVTDTDTSLSSHTYEWRLTGRTGSAGAGTIQTMTIKTLET